MPYKTNADLPAQVRDALPEAAQSRFRAVVNSALERGLSDGKAFASGWTVVRNGWDKPADGGKWVHKATGKRSLFVSRPVENAEALIDWAKSQGFKTTLAPEDMHVTQCYSKEPVQWPYAHDDAILIVSDEGRKVGPLGDQGAMVLHFASPTMSARYDQLKELGAKSDYPTYSPHITISWKAEGVDPANVQPYKGVLILGPERFREIDPDWKPDKIAEKANPHHDDHGRFSTGDGGGGDGGDNGGGNGGKMPEPDGPVLFHGTSSAAVDHIVSEGIIPAKSTGATAEHAKTFGHMIEMPDGKAAAAYFAASPYMAQRFAQMAAKATGGVPVVVPVHLNAEQAKALVWDRHGGGNYDTELTSAIPPSQVGKPAVGMDAIKSLTSKFDNNWRQFTRTSEQRSEGRFEHAEYEFVEQQASAVRDLMGKARGFGKAPDGKQQVIFMTFVVDEKTEKAGARHNAGDRKMVQEMHDHAVKLGAECSGMGKNLDEERFEKFDALTTLDQNAESVARVSIIKVDDELGLVFGWAMVCKEAGADYYDVQDDHIPEDAMLKASADFMLSRRVAKEMHFGDEKGTIVFAFPITEDVAKAMGITTERSGLMIAMKPSSAALLEKFRSGEYTGFSIGGQRLVDETYEEAA